MSRKPQDNSHRLGVGFAAIVVFVGMAFAILQLGAGAKPVVVLQIIAASMGIAVLFYVVVRLVWMVFGEMMASTSEHPVQRP